jgi:hypothetical protein
MEMKPYLSRSTFALRAKKLERLGYLEKIPDEKGSQAKLIRGTPMTLLFMRLVTQIKKQCDELSQSMNSKKILLEAMSGRESNDAELRKVSAAIIQDGEKMKGLFSLIASYAINLGESVAGDLLLPMLIDDFRKLNSELLSLLNVDKRILNLLAKEKLSFVSLDDLNEDFEYAFGRPFREMLPRFAKRLQTQ